MTGFLTNAEVNLNFALAQGITVDARSKSQDVHDLLIVWLKKIDFTELLQLERSKILQINKYCN